MGRKRLPCAQAWSTSGLTGRLLRHAPHGQVGQISPDKNVNCGYTTAAFTLSPEPRASLCCANLPGDWAFRLRSWSYGGTSVCSASLRPGVALAKTGFGHRLTAIPPVDVYGILMLMISTVNKVHVQGTSCLAVASSEGMSPHKFTPMPGVTSRCSQSPIKSALAELFVRQQDKIRLLLTKYANGV